MAKSVLGISVSQYDDKNEYQRQWRKLNRGMSSPDHEKVREGAWRRRYGITRDDYNRMLAEQGGCCALCNATEVGRKHTHFHVDHNHDTGKVRGLLCDLCNRGLGYFKDSAHLMREGARYLDERN